MATTAHLLLFVLCLFFQLCSGNVGLTESIEGEPCQFMVWLGSSVSTALVLHSFEVCDLFLASSLGLLVNPKPLQKPFASGVCFWTSFPN